MGIESKVAAGVRVEEVGYQLQFSKQELRKVVKEYSGREVCNVLTIIMHNIESDCLNCSFSSVLTRFAQMITATQTYNIDIMHAPMNSFVINLT